MPCDVLTLYATKSTGSSQVEARSGARDSDGSSPAPAADPSARRKITNVQFLADSRGERSLANGGRASPGLTVSPLQARNRPQHTSPSPAMATEFPEAHDNVVASVFDAANYLRQEQDALSAMRVYVPSFVAFVRQFEETAPLNSSVAHALGTARVAAENLIAPTSSSVDIICNASLLQGALKTVADWIDLMPPPKPESWLQLNHAIMIDVMPALTRIGYQERRRGQEQTAQHPTTTAAPFADPQQSLPPQEPTLHLGDAAFQPQQLEHTREALLRTFSTEHLQALMNQENKDDMGAPIVGTLEIPMPDAEETHPVELVRPFSKTPMNPMGMKREISKTPMNPIRESKTDTYYDNYRLVDDSDNDDVEEEVSEEPVVKKPKTKKRKTVTKSEEESDDEEDKTPKKKSKKHDRDDGSKAPRKSKKKSKDRDSEEDDEDQDSDSGDNGGGSKRTRGHVPSPKETFRILAKKGAYGRDRALFNGMPCRVVLYYAKDGVPRKRLNGMIVKVPIVDANGKETNETYAVNVRNLPGEFFTLDCKFEYDPSKPGADVVITPLTYNSPTILRKLEGKYSPSDVFSTQRNVHEDMDPQTGFPKFCTSANAACRASELRLVTQGLLPDNMPSWDGKPRIFFPTVTRSDNKPCSLLDLCLAAKSLKQGRELPEFLLQTRPRVAHVPTAKSVKPTVDAKRLNKGKREDASVHA